MTSPYRSVGDKNPFPKSASNSQLKKLGVFIGGKAGRVSFEIKFYGFAKIGFQFIHRIALGATPRKGRNFCPKTAFISLVNHRSNFHKSECKPHRATGNNSDRWVAEEIGYGLGGWINWKENRGTRF